MGAILESFFKAFIRHTLKRGLRGIFMKGTLQEGPVLLVSNHHSWWDGYVLGELCWAHHHPVSLLMLHEQLQKYPFLKSVGAVSHHHLREALGRLKADHALIVFPEGALNPAGLVQNLRPGVQWFAHHANCAVVPLALRVVLRGHQHPEAFVLLGAPCSPDQVQENLNLLISELDGMLSTSDPERPLAGYHSIMRGVGSDSERLNLASVLLKKLLRLQ
ncbi:lysophospholipid acyltransferase family protein [Deinococcus roseus]|uniref:1-acyl-sn-glycerol-3-phosphate acyltransferase n=1 Tax=Deinococcus roseus TaxID=392414 RepID=A0ABQ2D6G1_9DEIO|nr:lysophospholipid acyltransferase family protein [Deinococcus roseus]GGJ46419.1 1-acyl-sn-glycerol-3-phosphate acyltransferase [Deinococcus roseus]